MNFRLLLLKRSYSVKIPTNAPTVSENEQWLNHLTQLAKYKRRDNNGHSRLNQFRSSKSLINVPYEIQPIDEAKDYITVKSPIENFTSMRYLQSPNSSTHHSSEQGNFVDLKIIRCKSGKGGDGAVSFFRDAGRAIGPPDGGDGGDGGSVYIRAATGINSLSNIKTTYFAGSGSNGTSKQLDGQRGKDIMITVPTGTIVRWCVDPKQVRDLIKKSNDSTSIQSILHEKKVSLECTSEIDRDDGEIPSSIQLFRDNKEPGDGWIFKESDKEYHLGKEWFQKLNKKVKLYDAMLFDEELANDRFPWLGLDLSVPTEEPICLLKGGKGGLGNMHFLTDMIRNPKFALIGRQELESSFLLELKSLADIGLIGFPNAGKSTILNKISNAKPRIGHWKFTTLVPTIGTISTAIGEPSFTVADIPGIIEGASDNKGMGLEFIRHIERSKGWVFVVGLDSKDPLNDLKILMEELGGAEKIKSKNILVVCNKADLTISKLDPTEKFVPINNFCKENGWECLPISALNEENIDILKIKMKQCISKDSKL
ncbi:hypothetical protein TBLA_0C06590 [Henningerozyma blattae CBS 6284]|uniref:Obg family GTPase CgtA n=1 Tax=Henningerozyma blattae (strain ATCC 34711 / CBS 6284 / DSM 70876 / NBRC 10599 / NRRL Y-10934 / UCD 77-7) TaxID=1071380 RepID=I2H250_HENB6|nr:hypothetical protein TBLA_0C06590 [Tetrapisispora blattae CBS 6284]CCH60452.1 hypothetical protein TBLA_0C06590 [Tetrapisispora blattae CBS 6284]